MCISLGATSIADAQSVKDSLNINKNKSPISATKTTGKFSFQTLPENYAIQKLPFFCRQENKLEKITKIPFKLRVGDVNDCNYLEQKTGYKLR